MEYAIDNYNSNNHKANFFKSLAIVSIIFLWPEQIYIAHIQISLNYFLFAFIIIFFKTYLRDIITMGILIIFFYLLLVVQILSAFNLAAPAKTILYIPIFSFLVVFCFRFIKQIFKEEDEKKLFRLLRLFLKLQLSVQIIQLILIHIGFGSIMPHTTSPQYINDKIPRVSGFFYEPSSIGFSLSPFIYILVQDYKKFIKWFRYESIFVIIMILFLSFSTTFIGVIFLSIGFKIISVFRHIKLRNIVITLITGVLLVNLAMTNPQIYVRINQVYLRFTGQEIISSKINYSSGVFIKGFEMAKIALKKYPLGVGMENMQVLNKYTKVAQLGGLFEKLNTHNGGSILFKIISEFGYLGLIIAIYALLYLIKYSLKKDKNPYNLLIGSFVFGFISTFIRGPSYTAGVPILGLSVLFWVILDNLKKYSSPSYVKINKNKLNIEKPEIADY